MTAIAIATLFLGSVAGYVMAQRFMVRALAFALCACVGVFLLVLNVPADALPGDGFVTSIVALLMAPPLAGGLLGGAILGWLMQRHAKAT
ncbi:hypothetical protein [uncultured Tateyamaria sp.]|uniref:hypothetical protein n=1 Tax=uncultured Tateyamaria sp. TaxID=455651 RepID=UPI002637FACD|nr:hypothetical protein [uncultured Tateyamaria sp.]